MPPKRDLMKYKENRLKSFHEPVKIGKQTITWLEHNDEQLIEPLVDSGFYFMPTKTNSNRVVCAHCHKPETVNADAGSIPERHYEKNKTCISSLSMLSGIVREKYTTEKDIKDYWQTHELTTISKPLGTVAYNFRLRSFGKEYPLDREGFSQSLDSETLARAGFIYSPLDFGDDRVLCFYCGCSLDHWDAADVPIDEHDKNSQRYCYFLDCSKATEDIPNSSEVSFETSKEQVSVHVPEDTSKYDDSVEISKEDATESESIQEISPQIKAQENTQIQAKHSKPLDVQRRTQPSSRKSELRSRSNHVALTNPQRASGKSRKGNSDVSFAEDSSIRLSHRPSKKNETVDPNDAYWNKLPDEDLFHELLGVTSKTRTLRSRTPEPVSKMEIVTRRTRSMIVDSEEDSNKDNSSSSSISLDLSDSDSPVVPPPSSKNSKSPATGQPKKASRKETRSKRLQQNKVVPEEAQLEEAEHKEVTNSNTKVAEQASKYPEPSKSSKPSESSISPDSSKPEIIELPASDKAKSPEKDDEVAISSDELSDVSSDSDISEDGSEVHIDELDEYSSLEESDYTSESDDSDFSFAENRSSSKKRKISEENESEPKEESSPIIKSKKKLKLRRVPGSTVPDLENEVDDYGEENLENLEMHIAPVVLKEEAKVILANRSEKPNERATASPIKLEDDHQTITKRKRKISLLVNSKKRKPNIFDMSFEEDSFMSNRINLMDPKKGVKAAFQNSEEKTKPLEAASKSHKSPQLSHSPIRNELPPDISMSSDIQSIALENSPQRVLASDSVLGDSEDEDIIRASSTHELIVQPERLEASKSSSPRIVKSDSQKDEADAIVEVAAAPRNLRKNRRDRPRKLDGKGEGQYLEASNSVDYSEFITDIKQLSEEVSRSMDMIGVGEDPESVEEDLRLRRTNRRKAGPRESRRKLRNADADEVLLIMNQDLGAQVKDDQEEQIDKNSELNVSTGIEEDESVAHVMVSSPAKMKLVEQDKESDDMNKGERVEEEDMPESEPEVTKPPVFEKNELSNQDSIIEPCQNVSGTNIGTESVKPDSTHSEELKRLPDDVKDKGNLNTDRRFSDAEQFGHNSSPSKTPEAVLDQVRTEPQEKEDVEVEVEGSFKDATQDFTNEIQAVETPLHGAHKLSKSPLGNDSISSINSDDQAPSRKLADSSKSAMQNSPIAHYTRSSIDFKSDKLSGNYNTLLEASTPYSKNARGRNRYSIPESKVLSWEPAPVSSFLETLNNMEGTSADLNELTKSQNDLHDDYGSELTNFISAMPENEEAMTIQEWIRYSAANSKNIVREYAEEAIQFYERESQRALQILQEMPTTD